MNTYAPSPDHELIAAVMLYFKIEITDVPAQTIVLGGYWTRSLHARP